MHIELQCRRCAHHFSGSPEPSLELLLERLVEQGPWSALGDGETLEDRFFTSLDLSAALGCPSCGAPMAVTETSLGQLTKELLAQW